MPSFSSSIFWKKVLSFFQISFHRGKSKQDCPSGSCMENCSSGSCMEGCSSGSCMENCSSGSCMEKFFRILYGELFFRTLYGEVLETLFTFGLSFYIYVNVSDVFEFLYLCKCIRCIWETLDQKASWNWKIET